MKNPLVLFNGLLLALLLSGGEAAAQDARQQLVSTQMSGSLLSSYVPATADAPRTPLPRRVAALRASNTPTGSRVTINSDAPLDDYAAYREGGNFYVLIPRTEAAVAAKKIEGRGFTRAHVIQQGDDLVLKFNVEPDTKALANQSFNRLDIVFNIETPAQNPASAALSADNEHAALEPAPPAVANAVGSTARTNVDGAANVSGGTGVDAATVQRMLRRIEELEARIQELETRQTRQSDAAQSVADERPATAQSSATEVALVVAPASATPPASTAAGDHEDGSAGAHDDHVDLPGGTPRLQIQGFADINFRASDEKGSTNAFSLGQLDLFITSRLSERFSVLGELIIEADGNNNFSFEIHRLLLKYSLNDFFNVSAGRYHTSIGYYNTAFHHGSWFATAANRPVIFAFESKGGILPLHNVGVTATGRIPSAPFGLRYIAEIGNGRASRARSGEDSVVQTARDENNGKAFNLGIFARPSKVRGLQTGFSIYRDNLTPRESPVVGETIFSTHLVYQNPRTEWLNEAILVRHASRGRTFHTPGFYTQFSRRFGNTRPYFRYQYLNAPSDDPIFQEVGRRNGPSFGVRYDVTEFAAFKAQYDRTARRRLDSLNELILQLSFTF